jgi:hypothetical protein
MEDSMATAKTDKEQTDATGLTEAEIERVQTPVGTPENDPDLEAQRLQDLKTASETVPGGRYKVNGVWVNADGKPVDKDGNVIKE